MSDNVNYIPTVNITKSSQIQKALFPFDAFSADDPNVTSSPTLTLNAAWRLIAQTAYVGTAANIASANPVLFKGQIGYESDTLSFKIGDGSTAYNTLTYAYRGLPVSGEPSLGTPHKHYKAILSAATAPNNNVQTLSISAEVPAGTTMVALRMAMSSSGGTGQTFSITNSGGTENYGICRSQVTGLVIDSYCLSPVDSSRNIYWQVSNYVQDTVYLNITHYFC